jgi:hypothetical protein
LKWTGKIAGSGRISKVSFAKIISSAIHKIPAEKCRVLLRFSDVLFSVEIGRWNLVNLCVGRT